MFYNSLNGIGKMLIFINHKLMSRVYLQRSCIRCFWEWSEEHQGQNHMDKSTKCYCHILHHSGGNSVGVCCLLHLMNQYLHLIINYNPYFH